MVVLSVRVLHAVYGQKGFVTARAQGYHPESFLKGGRLFVKRLVLYRHDVDAGMKSFKNVYVISLKSSPGLNSCNTVMVVYRFSFVLSLLSECVTYSFAKTGNVTLTGRFFFIASFSKDNVAGTPLFHRANSIP